jgi:hypothetical protein
MHHFIIVDNETIMINVKSEKNKVNSTTKSKLMQETMKLFDDV